MSAQIHGYTGIILQVDLSSGKIAKKAVDPQDLADYLGGRGLGVKLLWDQLKEKPGTDPLGPDTPLLFMPGPVSGFPAPSSSRTCVVTKSPMTSPVKAKYAHSATVSYANMGGFFGPELRFAGYDVDGKLMAKLLSAIVGTIPNGNPMLIGERIYNLEKLFNFREGFTRADDVVPDRFFEEPLTVGAKKGAVLTRAQFKAMMDDFYTQRGWDLETSEPKAEELKSLGLAV